MRRLMTALVAVALLMAVAPAAVATPADGNGKKEVVEGVFGTFPVFCDEDGVPDLELNIDFRAQFMPKEQGKNDEVATFNVEFMYGNDAGEFWTFRDRGSDRFYEEDGVIYQAVSGRASAGNIGLLIIANPFTPQEEIIFQKGQTTDIDAEACARLA